MLEHLSQTVSFLQSKGIQHPQVGIILGTGLGRLATEIEAEVVVAYDEVPHFPISTVESHHGKLIYGVLAGKKVLAMQGRFHYYEGYNAAQLVYPVRVMHQLGIAQLLVSNAAGCLNLDWKKGDLMLLTDHLNLLPDNPLRGKNFDELGPRFPDMSEPYHHHLSSLFEAEAKSLNISLKKGVYAAVQGPMLETPAEYRMLKKLGADSVGMSTVPEAIAARHLNLPCAAISVLTDECDPDNLAPVALADILAVAAKAEIPLTQLIKAVVSSL